MMLKKVKALSSTSGVASEEKNCFQLELCSGKPKGII